MIREFVFRCKGQTPIYLIVAKDQANILIATIENIGGKIKSRTNYRDIYVVPDGTDILKIIGSIPFKKATSS